MRRANRLARAGRERRRTRSISMTCCRGRIHFPSRHEDKLRAGNGLWYGLLNECTLIGKLNRDMSQIFRRDHDGSIFREAKFFPSRTCVDSTWCSTSLEPVECAYKTPHSRLSQLQVRPSSTSVFSALQRRTRSLTSTRRSSWHRQFCSTRPLEGEPRSVDRHARRLS